MLVLSQAAKPRALISYYCCCFHCINSANNEAQKGQARHRKHDVLCSCTKVTPVIFQSTFSSLSAACHICNTLHCSTSALPETNMLFLAMVHYEMLQIGSFAALTAPASAKAGSNGFWGAAPATAVMGTTWLKVGIGQASLETLTN